MSVERVLGSTTWWGGVLADVGVNNVPLSVGEVLVNANWESATVGAPISNAHMWANIGAQVGNNTSTFEDASIVDVGGAHGKVINHANAANTYIDSANDAGMSMWVPLPESATEITMEYDMRWLTPSGTVSATNPWGKGGKLPGLCGTRPGQGVNPPSGGTSSVYGWSARNMWITPGAGFSGEGPRSPVELIGYFYHPNMPAGPASYGINKRTGVGWLGTGGVALDEWVNVKMYHKMNTVITEGATNPPADGIYEIYWNDVKVFEDTAVVYRRYAAASATHWCYDVYYGGGDATWAPTGNTNVQFSTINITKLA